jgi:hypothetical protein
MQIEPLEEADIHAVTALWDRAGLDAPMERTLPGRRIRARQGKLGHSGWQETRRNDRQRHGRT